MVCFVDNVLWGDETKLSSIKLGGTTWSTLAVEN